MSPGSLPILLPRQVRSGLAAGQGGHVFEALVGYFERRRNGEMIGSRNEEEFVADVETEVIFPLHGSRNVREGEANALDVFEGCHVQM